MIREIRKRYIRVRSWWELQGERVYPPAVQRRSVLRARQAPRRSLDDQPSRRPRLYVDVSVIAREDAGTGIQRVVRGVIRHLPAPDASDWEIIFVAADASQPYCPIDPQAGVEPIGEPIRAAPGDVFLGLDYSLHAIASQSRQLEQFRREGGRLWFLVHDLLPLQQPAWFSISTQYRYAKWLRLIAMFADGFLCNSAQTEKDLKNTLQSRFGLAHDLKTVVLPMGADIATARKTDGRLGATSVPPALEQRPYVLMVGTLEPRKGHDLVLSAFSRLWEQDEDTPLVLVGRRGWKTEALEQRITDHPLLGAELFRLDNVSDEQLEQIYRKSEGVVVAALAEGYGLPVIEALSYGKPVLARDLPVFRQHEGRGIQFFPQDADAAVVARALQRWLADVRHGRLPVTPPDTSWNKAAETLLGALSSDRSTVGQVSV